MSAHGLKRSLVTAVTLLALPVAVLAQSHSGHTPHQHGGSAADQARPTQPLDNVLVRDCWVRTMPANLPSAGYFFIENKREQPIKLTGISTEAFGLTMLHETVTQEGMARMQHTDDVEIAAGATLEFKPGGYHAMLEKPAGELIVGKEINVRFLFGDEGHVDASCLLQAPASLEKAHQH